VPSLTFQPPNTALYSPITPAQYTALIAAIKAKTQTKNAEVNGNGGSLSMANEADFAWFYDGISVLHLTIVAIHDPKLQQLGDQGIFTLLNSLIL
jgi:hypothetical protein